MRAWTRDDATRSVTLLERDLPEPGPGEVLVKVLACGVCRTDLHVVDGDLPVHRPGVIPGHQVVGTVAGAGDAVVGLREGDLVGIAWLRGTCGTCSWCRAGRENLCPRSLYTGWDADGGFAEFATVPESFAYLLPPESDPIATAPLLCAGIIGFRALARAALPPGGRLGIYGFGSSAHITAQLAMAAGAEVFAMTRGEPNRALARGLGVAFVGDADSEPPVPLDSAIIFAPVGGIVPLAMRATTAGGTPIFRRWNTRAPFFMSGTCAVSRPTPGATGSRSSDSRTPCAWPRRPPSTASRVPMPHSTTCEAVRHPDPSCSRLGERRARSRPGLSRG
jgi:propanol-preferring alcohol dehydrogenase